MSCEILLRRADLLRAAQSSGKFLATPARAYELLAQELEDWQDVLVWFADERCVGPEDDESNYKLALVWAPTLS